MTTAMIPHDLEIGSASGRRLIPRQLRPAARILLHRLRHRAGTLRSPFELYEPEGVLFVHVPKNAGKTVNGVVYDALPGPEASLLSAHHSAQYLRRLDRKTFDSLFKFAVVRDPRSRLVSAFNYLKFESPHPPDRRFADSELARFRDCDALCSQADGETLARLVRWPHFRPQVTFLCDGEGSLLVDALICFERLGRGLSVVSQHLGVHWAAPAERSTSSPSVGDAVKQLVDDRYPDDRDLHRLVAGQEDGVLFVSSGDAVARG